jgi:hydroxypyruvate isomerase
LLRFSANLGFLWPDRPLLDRIDAAARAGFKAIELHWPYETPARDLKARSEAHGLKLLGVNTSPGDMSKGEFGLGALPGRQADFRSSFDQSLSYCLEAGGNSIHCMAGRVDPAERGAARSVFVENLQEASRKAAPYGIALLLEPLNPRDAPGYFYSTVGEGVTIIKETRCANVRLMFDCYHVGIAEGDVLNKLAQFMPLIGHVQIAAVPSRAEPDESELDYRTVFDSLDRLGYPGYIGCEYKPRAQTEAGLSWAELLGIRLDAQ